MAKRKVGPAVPTDDAAINAGIAADPDNPEWTEADFTKARPAAEVLPALVGVKAAAELLKPKRGRPPLDDPKVAIKLRLDRDVVEGFRKTGPGWQSRINEALRKVVGL